MKRQVYGLTHDKVLLNLCRITVVLSMGFLIERAIDVIDWHALVPEPILESQLGILEWVLLVFLAGMYCLLAFLILGIMWVIIRTRFALLKRAF